MGFQGNGTGFIDYVIRNEQPVTNSQCTVQVIETADSGGILTLNVSFTDPVHGIVQVGISVFDYIPTTTHYADPSTLMIGFNSQSPLGGWASSPGSSLSLYISTSASSGDSRKYTGSFNAANLLWQGSGSQDSLDIKFGSYSFTATQDAADAAAVLPQGLSFRTGAGGGTVSYSIGTQTKPTTEPAKATTVSYYNDGVLYSVILNLQWTDSAQGAMVLFLTINPFTGTGTYSTADTVQQLLIMFSTEAAGTGSWGNSNSSIPLVVLNAIYAETPSTANWQGALQASGLLWTGQGGSKPALNLAVSALTITLDLSQHGS